MPRVGGEFVPLFPDVVPDTTIESAVHNGIVADFITDANAARPITAGGTGATSTVTARANLQAERAMATVTNYDSHVWENGSFWSAAGADGAPEGVHFYAGTAIVANNDQNYVALRVTSFLSGHVYIRLRAGGGWGAWTAEGGADYVDVTGDTMTGPLTIPTPSSTDPTAAMYAINRNYFDTYDTRMTEALNVLTARIEELERKIK